ncbi:hypothetical protein NYE44_01590 [Paenibacillus sp. FSL L8-0493]|uniref:hypothetical protein n=1 Tax=unclassified Paenibacillus TaxID=185978 RepID=UPI0030F5478F
MKLKSEEKIELSYLRHKGFRYLVRHEIGSVEVFMNLPQRDKENNGYRGGYDTWIETKTPLPMEERRRRRDVELGKYEFITWKDEPMLIDDILREEAQ